MRRLIRTSLAALAVLLLSVVRAPAEPEAIAADRVCSHIGAPFVEPCRTIHGNLVLGGDNIRVRIYPSGTKRILGYADGALRCTLPKQLEEILAGTLVIEADVTIPSYGLEARSHAIRLHRVCEQCENQTVIGLLSNNGVQPTPVTGRG